MRPDRHGAVTRWIGDLKAGDVAAVQPLWEQYFERLVRLARARLRRTPHTGAEADEEDIALSAFDSFCLGASRGRFPLLKDRDDLWRMLVVITRRKALDHLRRHTRAKRRADRVVEAEALEGLDGDASGLAALVGTEPSPEFAAMVAEEYRRLLEILGDDQLRRIAVMKMEGYTNEEIRVQLGCALRTVANKLELIRTLWMAEARP